MTSRRVLKAAEAIREVVSMAILTDLRDPRIQHVTVTYVELSADMRQAKVHVSVMGDDSQQQLSLQGLQHAAGYLQQKISHRIETRYTPRLKFVLDQGVKRSIEVSRILDEVLGPSAAAGRGAEDRGAEDSGAEDSGAEDRGAEDSGAEDSRRDDNDLDDNDLDDNDLDGGDREDQPSA